MNGLEYDMETNISICPTHVMCNERNSNGTENTTYANINPCICPVFNSGTIYLHVFSGK